MLWVLAWSWCRYLFSNTSLKVSPNQKAWYYAEQQDRLKSFKVLWTPQHLLPSTPSISSLSTAVCTPWKYEPMPFRTLAPSLWFWLTRWTIGRKQRLSRHSTFRCFTNPMPVLPTAHLCSFPRFPQLWCLTLALTTRANTGVSRCQTSLTSRVMR